VFQNQSNGVTGGILWHSDQTSALVRTSKGVFPAREVTPHTHTASSYRESFMASQTREVVTCGSARKVCTHTAVKCANCSGNQPAQDSKSRLKARPSPSLMVTEQPQYLKRRGRPPGGQWWQQSHLGGRPPRYHYHSHTAFRETGSRRTGVRTLTNVGWHTNRNQVAPLQLKPNKGRPPTRRSGRAPAQLREEGTGSGTGSVLRNHQMSTESESERGFTAG